MFGLIWYHRLINVSLSVRRDRVMLARIRREPKLCYSMYNTIWFDVVAIRVASPSGPVTYQECNVPTR